MAPKDIRTLSSDVLKLSICSWKKYFPFPFYLGKMTILLKVGDFDRWVGKCGDVQSPHYSNMISHKNHTWVLWNKIGQILFFCAMQFARPQNWHFCHGVLLLALFLGFKPKNEAYFLCLSLLHQLIIIQFDGATSAADWFWAQRHCQIQQWRGAQNTATTVN